jgi:large subunit ribosomal protein L22
MVSKAIAKYVRISSKKARLVVDVVRGKSVEEALNMLPSVKKKASDIVRDLVKSAFSNLKRKHPEEHYTEDMLFISKITANEGPQLKRYRAATMGRASMIIKRSSHIEVQLDFIPEKLKAMEAEKDKKKPAKQPKKETKLEKPAKKMAAAKGSK